MMNTRLFWVAGALSAAAFLQTLEVGAGTPRYRFDNWKVEQGLPQNTVQAIRQTRDGYLWVGTRFGLGRFDGVTFTHFNLANTPAMVSDNCTALAEDSEGSLWIGTDKGLLRWQNRQFTHFASKDGLSDDYVLSLSASRDGGVWIGSSAGMSRFVGGALTNLSNWLQPGRQSVSHLLEDREGSLWFDTTNGVTRLNPATGTSEAILKNGNGWNIHEDGAGRIWFGTRRNARDDLYRWQDGQITSFSRDQGPQSTQSQSRGASLIFESQDGILWVCMPHQGEGGLYQFKNGKFIEFPLPAWLENCALNCLFEDHEKNLWIGTSLGGLVRMQPRRIRSYTKDDGLPYNDTWSACEGHDGSVWVGSDRLFARIRDDQVTAFSIPGDPPGEVKCVLEDREGNLWVGKQTGVGSTNASLYLIGGGVATNRAAEFGIAARSIRALYQDRAGSLWIGTSSGIYQFQHGRVTHYSTKDGLTSNNVRAFLEDQHHDLWIATYGAGVNCLRDGKFITALATTNGLSNDNAWALHEDEDGTLWIGTEFGLNRYKEGRLFTFTRKEGLFDDLVNCILDDSSGHLWISCNRGIYRVKRALLNAVAEGRTNHVHVVAYAEGDGMESSETNGENQPAGWKARDGRLWFPTTKGVVVIDPKALQDNELPPPVVIEQVSADDHLVLGDGLTSRVLGSKLGAPGSTIRLPPGSARVLEIRYTANSFVAPDKMSFRFRLEGYDDQWREAGTRRLAYYTNLRPGSYRFAVQACNNHGYWNEVGDSFSFYLAPHFYQTVPFYVGCALGAVLLAAAIQAYRLRVQRRLLGLEQQHALDLERDRIAQDMHDDLGANLTKIAILSEIAKRDLSSAPAAEIHVEQISTIARAVVDNISELVWATNPRNDRLDNFASYLREYAAQFFDSTPIACQLDFQVPSLPLAAELRRNLFLVVKEALHNIVKHSGATKAAVTLRLQTQPAPGQQPARPSKSLVIIITDNGCGFEAASIPLFHNGLQNMRQRIDERGGRFDLQSQPGLGTQILITVRLS